MLRDKKLRPLNSGPCLPMLSEGASNWSDLPTDSSHYKECNSSCFMYLSEIVSKLQMCKITNIMAFSDSLLVTYVFF